MQMEAWLPFFKKKISPPSVPKTLQVITQPTNRNTEIQQHDRIRLTRSKCPS